MESILPASLVPMMTLTVVALGLWYHGSQSKFPRVGNTKLLTWIPTLSPMRYSLDVWAQRGYLEFNKYLKPFVLKFFGYDYIILPPRYLEDLKRAKSEALSFNISFSEAFNIGATVGDLYWGNSMGLVVSQHLNKQLKALTPDLVDEVSYAFEKELGNPSDWTRIAAAKLNGDIIHRVTNRIMVGSKLCRDDEFLKVSYKFTGTLLPSAVWTNFISFGPFRDLASKFTTFFHRWELEASIKLLEPEVISRLEQRQNGTSETSSDAVDWMIEVGESLDDPRELMPRRLTENVLHLLFAANSAPGALVTQMVYQVLTDSEYLQPLRDEIQNALRIEGSWTSDAISMMPLLDSFVREVMRMYPPGSIACTRTVVDQPFTFRDGLTLAPGSRFAFPILAIQTDPENYDQSSTFNGFRFVERNEKGDIVGSRISSTAISPTYLPFGYGKHACPGRFFGILKAKLVFGKLLHSYDFKWAEEMKKRPANISIEGMVPPHQTVPILIRSRPL